jgi:hypothetical protein
MEKNSKGQESFNSKSFKMEIAINKLKRDLGCVDINDKSIIAGYFRL